MVKSRTGKRYQALQVIIVALAVALVWAPASAWAKHITILAIGDSLTAGYGLDDPDSFPVQLEARLKADGYDVTVQNAGVSGDTSAMGLARLDWVLGGGAPDIVILELGANDALRGISPANTRANLVQLIERIRAKHIPILLAGMMAPRNLGPDYIKQFDPIYPELAAKYGLPLYPFFLNGVIDHPDLLQDDGMHPTPDGVKVIVDGILPVLKPMIDAANATP